MSSPQIPTPCESTIKNIVIFVSVLFLFVIFYFLCTCTQNNYKNEKYTIVLFYTPKCKFCKQVEPIWDDLMKKYHNMIKIDCEANKEEAVKNKIEGVPTIRVYEGKNQIHEYKGKRDKESLEKFVTEYF